MESISQERHRYVEKIQRRATKLIPGLRDLRYEERLKECVLTTLETRRLKGHQIEVFKILNGYGNIGTNYEMGGTILSKTMKEKYLGVSMNANMIVSEQMQNCSVEG